MTKRRDPTVVFLACIAAALVVVTLVAVVLGGGGDDEEAGATTTLSTATTLPPDPAATCPEAEGRAPELRRCLEQSIAFIETEVGRGSGVLLDGGHIITNAHVVDPFGFVDVTFPGGEHHEDVRVVGIDAFTDIALLATIETDRPGLTMEATDDDVVLEEPNVFLVGYPGGIEGDDPQVTLTSGIVSRLRAVDAFDLTYLQTDAAIAGGQSGGALVDHEGRLLGISGLKFAGEFALALSTEDVMSSMRRIVDEGGDQRHLLPNIADAASFPVHVELPFEGASAVAVIPASDEDREVEVSITGDRALSFDAYTFGGRWLGSGATQDSFDDDLFGDLGGLLDPSTFDPADFGYLPQLEPNTWELEVPANETVEIRARFDDFGFGRITVDTTEPYVAFADVPPLQGIAVGDTVEIVGDRFTYGHIFTILLDEGEEVEVAARSAAADPYFTVIAPDGDYDPFENPTGDNGGGGLYDLDAVATFRAEETGRYFILVGTFDYHVAGYQLSVTAVE